MKHEITTDNRPYSIWGKYKNSSKPECIDAAASKDEADYLLNEYRIAYGSDWQLWIEPE